MKEHGLIVVTSGVQAILDGRKTQTRRVIKPQPQDCIAWKAYPEFWDKSSIWVNCSQRILCPYGQVGDRLWVRETCVLYKPELQDARMVIYKANLDTETASNMNWHPSIHMPRWASRITLEITGVRVERLQEITEEDAKAEGIIVSPLWRGGVYIPYVLNDAYRKEYCKLWDSLNAKRGYGWDTNPWCWCISFKRVDG